MTDEEEELPELNFEGLSLHEMAVQLSSLSEARRNRSAQAQAPAVLPTNVTDPRDHDPLNVSDYFNSRDELVLDRLTEWADSDPDDDEDAKSEASDVSSASTESITVSVLKPEHPESGVNRAFGSVSVVSLSNPSGAFLGDMVDRVNENPSSSSRSRAAVEGVNAKDKTRDQAKDEHYDGDVSDLVRWSENESDTPNSSSFRARFHPVPNYGCRVSPGFGYQGLNVLKPSASSGWRILPGTENEQIFTRAPNFRTPGGYKPPLFEKEPRLLSDAEVHDEVKQMYAEAEAEKELESQVHPNVRKNKSNPSPSAAKDCGEGDSNSKTEQRDPIPSSCDQKLTPKSEKAKRRLTFENVNGDGDTGTGEAPLPDLNLGGRDFPEVDEPLVTRGRSYLCGQKEDPQALSSPSNPFDMNSPYTGDISRCLPRRISRRLSPESRKANIVELDRLWKDIQETKHKMEDDMQSLRNTQDPFTNRPSTSAASSRRKEAPADLSPSSSSKQNQQQPPLSPILKAGSSTEKLVVTPNKFIEPLPLPKTPTKVTFSDPAHLPPTKIPGSSSSKSRPKKLTKKAGSRGKGIQVQRKAKAKGTTNPKETSTPVDVVASEDEEEELSIPFIPRELEDVELSAILKETDLEESDLDDILSQITEFHPPGHLFDEKDSPVELSSALQQLQISDWAKSGAGEYVEKFYEEKYKRQHCEKEIGGLQKKLLDLKERVAVLEGILKTKEFTVQKYTKLWEGLVKQWRTHEKSCKANTSKLESENTALKAEVEESKGRISEYEEELGKAVQLSTDFKEKVEEALETNEMERQEWREERKALLERLEQMKETVQERQAEKEVTMRALRESQSVLDNTRTSLESTNGEVAILLAQIGTDASKLNKLTEEKESLESHFKDVLKEKKATETNLVEVQDQLEKEKTDKALLESKLTVERKKIKEESERLHEYYNSKMREILTSQTDKIVAAEKLFLQTQENKLKLVHESAERRVEEMREKCRQECQLMRSHFDSQMEFLKRDSEEKGRLIGTVSRQLRTYSEKGSQDVSFYEELPEARARLTTAADFDLFSESVMPKKKRTSTSPLKPNPPFETSEEMRHCISSLVYAYNEKKLQKRHNTNVHLEPNN